VWCFCFSADSPKFLRWQVITAVDVVTEVLICLLPVMLTWSLNMPLKRKFYVFIAFSFRLPLIAASAHHLACLQVYPYSAEPQFAVTNALLLQQVMVTWSMISSTIPNMRGFMSSFTTGISLVNETYGKSSRFSNSTGFTEFHALQSITSNSTACKRAQVATRHKEVIPASGRNDSNLLLRPDPIEHSTTISHPDRVRIYSTRDILNEEENASQEMVIKKEVQWDVHHELRQGAQADTSEQYLVFNKQW
jgi:hypothetical protein